MAGGHAWQGVCVAGGCAWWGACIAGEMATAADGTHPTGMHSSIEFHLNSISTGICGIQTKIFIYVDLCTFVILIYS